MKYVCSVYSLNANGDASIMQRRYEFVRDYVAQKLNEGITLFSPIAHCHEMAKHNDMPRTWSFWKKHDLNYIDHCDGLVVLMMDGWEDSEGITDEIAYAKQIGKPIEYVEVS